MCALETNERRGRMYQYGYDEHALRRELEYYFETHGLGEAQKALEFAWEKHDGQTRINGQPFIIHPLFVAKYGISIGAKTEEQICIALLHDICEDCGIEPTDLPFSEDVQRGVSYLTFKYDYGEDDDADTKQLKKIVTKSETYARLIEEPRALICKGVDRYHNLTTAEELPENKIVKNVLETHRWLLPVIYNALTIRKFSAYYHQFYTLSINLRSLNDLLAMKHGIALNTMT